MQSTKSQVEIIITLWATEQYKKAQSKFSNFKYFGANYIFCEDKLEEDFQAIEDKMIDADDPNLDVVIKEYEMVKDEVYGEYGSLGQWIAEMLQETYNSDMEYVAPTEEDAEMCDQPIAELEAEQRAEIKHYLDWVRSEFRS